jgi:hypothetical protein
MRDTYDRFTPAERGRFGENEEASSSPTKAARSDLMDMFCWLRNDNPDKKAIAVSAEREDPFEKWKWLPRSLVDYELAGQFGFVRVTMPERLAKEKGLI